MMKTNFTSLKAVVLFSTVFLFFISCDKTEDKIQTFDDVFDTSSAVALNSKIMNASSIDELYVEIGELNLDIPEIFGEISLNQIITDMEEDLVISTQEKTLLLQNDISTYEQVIERFGSIVSDFEESGVDFETIDRGELEQYAIKVKETPDNFYVDDYYSGVIAMQSFLNEQILEPLKVINEMGLEKSATIATCGDCNMHTFLEMHEINNCGDILNCFRYWFRHRYHHGGCGGGS